MGISTQPLVQALAIYDAGLAQREHNWRAVETNEDVFACQHADEVALNLVREAFYEVTKDRNSHSSAMCIGIHFARKVAALGEI